MKVSGIKIYKLIFLATIVWIRETQGGLGQPLQYVAGIVAFTISAVSGEVVRADVQQHSLRQTVYRGTHSS